MIDGKTHQEILTLFDNYRKLHAKISLTRFMLFAGIGTAATHHSKGKFRNRVDALLKNHLKDRGLQRREIILNRNTDRDVVYEPRQRQPEPPLFSDGLTISYDPALATWTPADGEAVRQRELRRRAEYQAAREREMAEERASVRGMR